MLPPEPPRSYVPSPEEVELALSYVECADETNFGDKLRAAETTAREEVLSTRHNEVLGFEEEYRRIVDQLPPDYEY